MQQLQDKSGSGVVTIPKEGLDRDGILTEDGEIPNQQSVAVDRLGQGCYLVRFADGGLPDVEQCDVVERLAAQRAQAMLSQDVHGRARAD